MIWYGAWSGRTVPTDKMTPPNTPLPRTLLRVERDRADFEGWNQLEGFPDLLGRRR